MNPSPEERQRELMARMTNADALLSRGDLGALGLTRAQVDSTIRRLPVVQFAGVRKPMVRVGDYRQFLEESTYRGDRLRPC